MKHRFLLSLATLVFVSGAVFAQPTGQVVPRGYLLSPGDEIVVKVIGEEQFGFRATVDENGMVSVPFAETAVAASCRSQFELQDEVKKQLAKYLRNPQVSLDVPKKTIVPITVYGEVNKPSQLELTRKRTLVEIIALAGGVKDDAGGVVQVFRPIKPLCSNDDMPTWRSNAANPNETPFRTFSLAGIETGGEEANPIIYPGDVVVVEKASPVYITGEVLAPQGIYVKERGLTLTQAVAQVSGFRPEAKTKAIQIQRKKPNSHDVELITVNYDLIVSKQQPDIVLQPYDIVGVDRKKDSLGVSLFKFAIGLAKAGATAASTSGGYRVLY